MRKLTPIISTAGLLIGIASAPSAAEKPDAAQSLNWAYQTEDFIDHKLLDRNRNELGTITELVFDKHGKISYLILSRGGILGINSTKVMIPWKQMGDFETMAGKYISDVTVDELENAEPLSEDELAAFVNPFLIEKVDRIIKPRAVGGQTASGGASSDIVARNFKEIDADNNGRLSKQEAAAASGLEASFEDVDRNDDKVVDFSEYSNFISKRAP